MKDKLIKTLVYPRQLFVDKLEIDTCPHYGRYDSADGQCLECEKWPECLWLTRNDEFVALEKKSNEDLIAALGYAIDLVDAQLIHWEHETIRCRCEICVWLRQAKKLFTNLSDVC